MLGNKRQVEDKKRREGGRAGEVMKQSENNGKVDRRLSNERIDSGGVFHRWKILLYLIEADEEVIFLEKLKLKSGNSFIE